MKNIEKKWIDIPGYDGKYSVSNYGEVMNKKPQTGKPRLVGFNSDYAGYLRVTLNYLGKAKQYYVHQLVARMFIPNPLMLAEVNHKDGNKTNNFVDNLEWCTRSENMLHAFATGLKKNHKGSDSALARKCYQYDLQGNFIREWGSMVEAAEAFDDVTGNVCAACSGKYKTFHNYIWSYEKKEINPADYRWNYGEKTYQYSKEGELIAEHFNMEDAVKATGVDKSNITKCCLGKRKTAGGFIWSHEPLNFNMEGGKNE